MELIKRHKLIFAIIAVQIIALPIFLYLVRQQQETRTGALASTSLYFIPNSTSSTPIVKNVGQTFPVDVMVNPGVNLVTIVKLDIRYDPTKISLSNTNPVVVNTAAFPVILEGPAYSSGRIQITVAIGADHTRVIQTQTKVLTLNLVGPSAQNSPTPVSYGASSAIYSIASTDSSTENVLSTSSPAYVQINAIATNTPTPSLTPTKTPTPTPTKAPTPTPTPLPNPIISVSPTTVTAGGNVTVTVSKGPGNFYDWVGLYRVGDSEFDYLDWQYLNGEQFPPDARLTSATLSFTMPIDQGQYHFRLLEDDGFNTLATSQTVTVNPAPTTVPQPKTILNFNSIKLHGIGSGGDNPNPNSLGTQNPLRPVRNLNVEVYNTSGALVTSIPGEINYNGPSLGNFSGSVEVPSSVTGGSYVLKVKSPYYLKKQLPGFINLVTGQTNQVVQTSLVAGDVNNDNKLSTLDYDIIIGCYSDILPAKNCDNQRKLDADISDDGFVNHDDYNLFLRELSVQSGN